MHLQLLAEETSDDSCISLLLCGPTSEENAHCKQQFFLGQGKQGLFSLNVHGSSHRRLYPDQLAFYWVLCMSGKDKAVAFMLLMK